MVEVLFRLECCTPLRSGYNGQCPTESDQFQRPETTEMVDAQKMQMKNPLPQQAINARMNFPRVRCANQNGCTFYADILDLGYFTQYPKRTRVDSKLLTVDFLTQMLEAHQCWMLGDVAPRCTCNSAALKRGS